MMLLLFGIIVKPVFVKPMPYCSLLTMTWLLVFWLVLTVIVWHIIGYLETNYHYWYYCVWLIWLQLTDRIDYSDTHIIYLVPVHYSSITIIIDIIIIGIYYSHWFVVWLTTIIMTWFIYFIMILFIVPQLIRAIVIGQWRTFIIIKWFYYCVNASSASND